MPNSLLKLLSFSYPAIIHCAMLCAVFVISGCNHETAPAAGGKKPKLPPADVYGKAVEVQLDDWPIIVRTQGSLVAGETTTIGTKVAGRVIETMAEIGDVVKAGAPLIKLDESEYRIQVAQAEAQLLQARSAVGLKVGDPLEALNPDNAPPVREARAIFNEATQAVKRLRQLSSQSAISATDLEVAEAAERVADAKLASAQNAVREKIALISVQMAQLDLAKQRLAESITYVPMDGVIQSRMVSIGSYVQPGQALVTMVKTSVLKYRASVPERYAQSLAVGQEVRIKLDAKQAGKNGAEEMPVTISRINPTIDPQSRSLTFEADVPNQDGSFRTGLFVEATVVIDKHAKALSVPMRSVVRFAGVDKVWKVIDKEVKDQPIQLGRQYGERVEVLKGIVPGDKILELGSKGKAGNYLGEAPDS